MAVTDFCLRNKKFKNYVANDIYKPCIELLQDAFAGKFRNEKRWISREDFFRLKDIEPYISFCWSFGNNNVSYLYGKDIEPYKKAAHYVIIFSDYEEMNRLLPEICEDLKTELRGITNTYQRMIKFKKVIRNNLKNKSLERLERLQSLQSLERLKRLERLQSLQSLKSNIHFYSTSYDKIDIEPNSLIYCDIPYFSTSEYRGEKFNHEKFWDWCAKQKEQVIISEYWMPEDRFICISEIKKQSTLCATSNKAVTEKLFIPKHQREQYYKSMNTYLFDELYELK